MAVQSLEQQFKLLYFWQLKQILSVISKIEHKWSIIVLHLYKPLPNTIYTHKLKYNLLKLSYIKIINFNINIFIYQHHIKISLDTLETIAFLFLK